MLVTAATSNDATPTATGFVANTGTWPSATSGIVAATADQKERPSRSRRNA
jgi:hypothetical protein